MTKEELLALREERKRMSEELERRRTNPPEDNEADLEYDYWLTLILMDEGATKH